MPDTFFAVVKVESVPMVELPGRGDGPDGESVSTDEDPIVTCRFQDGTLAVYDEWLQIDRPGRSKFSDKAIQLTDVRGITYQKRFVISYLQIESVGVEESDAGLLSTPVDENTLHFGRGKRDCAKRARDAIKDGAGLW